jgi:2,4-diketo-3-deoxy-L-fuconate hydrolase
MMRKNDLRRRAVRIATVDGRTKLLVDGGQVDVESASNGRFSANPDALFSSFSELRIWGETVTQADEGWNPTNAGPPVPNPRQVFAVALNYSEHAGEAGFQAPAAPLIFTKFPTSVAGPVSQVELPEGSVDWEVELVAVVGKKGRNVPTSAAWDYVAGLTVGQDLSERQLQMSGPAPQFNLGKSYAGFSPIGPALVTLNEIDRPGDLGLGCDINGEEVQKGRTTDMIFCIPELVSYLSGIVTLLPGDLVFTGTPSGVGMARTPPRFLQAGERLHSWIEHIGEIEQTFVSRKIPSEKIAS